MAVVLGTNAGFVSVSPTNSPAATSTTVDAFKFAVKDTAPVGAIKITEIGWWNNAATEEANFEVGLYSHDAVNNKPNVRLFVAPINAKGTGSAEWKRVTVDWEITAGTIYWIAFQLDNTASASKSNYSAQATIQSHFVAATTLSDPWGSSTASLSLYSIYALVSLNVLPSITDQSSDTIVNEGGVVNLFVTAEGIPDPEYQWYFKNV